MTCTNIGEEPVSRDNRSQEVRTNAAPPATAAADSGAERHFLAESAGRWQRHGGTRSYRGGVTVQSIVGVVAGSPALFAPVLRRASGVGKVNWRGAVGAPCQAEGVLADVTLTT